MPGSTPWRNYPIPVAGDIPDGQTQIRDLAMAVDADVKLLSTGMRLATILYFESSGTFVKADYPGIAGVMVDCVGAGGGSGRVPATSAGQTSWGSAGCGGAYTRSWFDAGDLGASETVTVGVGGAGGDSGTPDAATGGDSSFGALVTAGGGEGGNSKGPVSMTDGSNLGESTLIFGGSPAGTYLVGVEGGSSDGLRWVSLGAGDLAGYPSLAGTRGTSAGGPYTTQPRVHSGMLAGENQASYGTPGMRGARGSGANGATHGFRTAIAESATDGADGTDGLVVIWVFVSG